MLLESISGGLLALLLAYLGTVLFPKRHLKIWAYGLIIAAAIYVGFALWGKHYGWLSIELSGLAFYAVPALISLRYSKYWLALGWSLHTLWDILLHSGGHPEFVPSWYPGMCLGFDLAIAGFVIWWLKKGKV